MQGLHAANSVHKAAQLKGPIASSRPVLYTHTLCPYAARVWLTLLHKRVEFDLVHVDLSNKPRWYHNVNARGLVPAVQHGGKTLVESIDICRWLDKEFAYVPMTPSDAAGRESMDRLIGEAAAVVAAGLDMVAGSSARSWGIGASPTGAQQRQFESATRALAVALQACGGPYLQGEQVTLADMVHQPFLERFDLCLRHFSGIELASLHGGSLSAWLGQMRQLLACQVASPNEKKLLEAYCRHMSLDFFDYDPYDALTLHPHVSSS